MSETALVAMIGIVAGILGTLAGAIIPSWLQHRAEDRRFVAEAYLKYKIESLQRLHRAIFRCHNAFEDVLFNHVQTADAAKNVEGQLAPGLDEFFEARMLSLAYVTNTMPDKTLERTLLAFTTIRDKMRMLAAGVASYPLDVQAQDLDALRDSAIDSSNAVAELLNPKVLRSFDENK